MAVLESRPAELGYILPSPPEAVDNYPPASSIENFVWLTSVSSRLAKVPTQKDALEANLLNVLVYFYLKGQKSTLSIDRARELSHCQDSFIGIDVERDMLWHEPFGEIENILASWNSGSEVNR